MSGKSFEVPLFFLHLFLLLKITKSNLLIVKGLAKENEKSSAQMDFLKKVYRFPFLEPFSTQTLLLILFKCHIEYIIVKYVINLLLIA